MQVWQRPVGRRQFGVALAAAALPWGKWASAQQGANSDIILGQSAALSGALSNVGRHFSWGAKLAFAEAGAASPSERVQVKLISLDDGGDAQRCRINTRKLLDAKVSALFGYTGITTSLAALPLVTDAEIPFFGPLTGAQRLRSPFNRWVFHVRASYEDELELTIGHLTDLGLSRIGLFYQGDSFGQAGLYAANKALAARQLSPTAIGVTDPHSQDVASAVQMLLAASPQAIVQVCSHVSSAAFVRRAREAGYSGTFHNVSLVDAQALGAALGSSGTGVMISQVVPSPWQRSQQLTREFVNAVERFGSNAQANYANLEGYFTARVFLEGVRNALQRGRGRFNSEGLVAGLEKIDQRVAGLAVAYSANNHQGSRFVEMSVLTGDGRVRV